MVGKPFIMVGPSGVGKCTLLNEVLAKYEGIFEKKVSYTTRPEKKTPSKKGSNYYHISQADFDKVSNNIVIILILYFALQKVAAGDFVEWKEVAGWCYGTCKKELDRISLAGRIPIIEVNVEGALQINKNGIEGNFLFVYPPSFEDLRKRIGNRVETEEEFKKRIELAISEIEAANNSVLFTNRLINDNLEKAIEQFFTLVKALYF